MRVKPPVQKTQKSKMVKGLMIVGTITLLSSFGLGLWSSLTGNYTAVLDYNEIELLQLEAPSAGMPCATVHTTAGDMQFTLYPEQCPETVANFRRLAESGYYDNTYVYETAPEVFFAAGSKELSPELPEDWATRPEEHVPQELSPKLWPLRGALCALPTGTEGGFWKILTKTQDYFSGSRFLVCNSIEMTDEIQEGLRAGDNEAMQRIAEAFIEHGGIPNYAQQMTVFGQMTEGFEVLDAITSAEVTGEQDATRPKEDILITSVEIGTVS